MREPSFTIPEPKLDPQHLEWVEREHERDRRKRAHDALERARKVCVRAMDGAYGDTVKQMALSVFGSTPIENCNVELIVDGATYIQLARRALRDGVRVRKFQEVRERRLTRERDQQMARDLDDLDNVSEPYCGTGPG